MIGQVIRDYRVIEEIGSGGFGAVYRADELSVGRDVAIKVILPNYATNEKFLKRFDREAHLVAQLEHMNIVPLYSYWHENDEAFLVMRYIRGGSLRDLIDDKGVMPLSTSLRLLEQIADALDFAHANNIVHRDLKPENILIDERGNAYLTDFGIAKSLTQPSNLTDDGTIAGTITYASPEQLKSQDVTPQSDIYAFGIILYEMLTGEHPFKSATITQMILRHLNEPLAPVTKKRAELPSEIDILIAKCTAKSPVDRYQNFADVIQQMRIILYEKPSTTISSAHPKKLIDHNRQSMLQNMRQFWIKGMLENSLTNSLIELSLLTNTDAVERPWDAILRKTDSSQTALPVKANSLLEVFDQANGKLLILGAPGSGKTTMLLQLLQDLLARAESDPEYLIPVVVNLSTWGELMRPLEQWLKSRLIDQYYVPENIAEQWIQNDKLTILLDGLDEVEEGKRHQCTRAINAFRRDHGFCDIVVTSRTTEYMGLADQLVLNAVINIQPLNDAAIFSYLNNFPDDTVKALTTVLHDDTNLRDLCRSPFILVTMAIAYRNVSVEEISYFGTFAERRLHLFSAYIDRMVEMSDDLLKYDPTEFRHYLGYIAKQMVSRSMTVFAVESPQPYWLNDDEKIRVMRLSSIIYFSLFLFLLVLAIVLTPNYLYGLIILISLILSSGGASAQGITLSGSFKFNMSLIEGLVIPIAFTLIWYILSLPQAILVATILVLLLGFEMSGDVSVKQNITPGDVIRRNYLVILAVFVISLVIITLVTSLVFTMPQGLIMGLIFATLIIIAKTNTRGLLLFYTLRLHLTNQHNLPLRLKAFLENAVTLLMVRRIGSSYIFIHRYLLEYFAETFTTKR